MNPYVKLVKNGNCVTDSATELISKSEVITQEQAIEIINNGVPEKPYEKKGYEWDSYCTSLSKYPVRIKKKILKRDNILPSELKNSCVL